MPQEDQYINHGKSGEFDCIWTASNTIDFQECIYDFNCENCTLDTFLRNLVSVEISETHQNPVLIDTDFLDRIIKNLEDLKPDPKIIYLKDNLILKHLFANIYYLGINPLVLGLLDNINSVKEYMKRVYFSIDQNIITIEGDWGQLVLKAPMTFLLLDKLNWTPEDIINRPWLALIVINQSEILDSQVSVEVWKTEKIKVLKKLVEYKDLCLKVNPTRLKIKDKIKYLYQLIGKIEYLKLLNFSADN